MDIVILGGIKFDVSILEVEENFTILYGSNTGRTIARGARMILDPLGTFYAHKVTFARKRGKEAEFDRLYMFLSKPRYSGIQVEIVHNQTTLKYEAYVSTGLRKLKKFDQENKKVYWDKFTANFVPMEAQVIPE